jgi:hypothetical protein
LRKRWTHRPVHSSYFLIQRALRTSRFVRDQILTI